MEKHMKGNRKEDERKRMNVTAAATANERVSGGDHRAEDDDDEEEEEEEEGDSDAISLSGAVPQNIETLQQDWDNLYTTTPSSGDRRRVARSHGFATITKFRSYMQQQQAVDVSRQRRVAAVAAAQPTTRREAMDELNFAWKTWELQPIAYRKELAGKFGFLSIADMEEYLRIQVCCRETKEGTVNNDHAMLEEEEDAKLDEPALPPKKKRKRRRRIIPKALVYKKRK